MRVSSRKEKGGVVTRKVEVDRRKVEVYCRWIEVDRRRENSGVDRRRV